MDYMFIQMQMFFCIGICCPKLKLKDPKKAIAVLCGQKEMTEQTIEMLENAGVPRERILMNF